MFMEHVFNHVPISRNVKNGGKIVEISNGLQKRRYAQIIKEKVMSQGPVIMA
jgi:hypothetical protein